MTKMRSMLLASAAAVVALGAAGTAQAADQILSGAITSATGQKLGGDAAKGRDCPVGHIVRKPSAPRGTTATFIE